MVHFFLNHGYLIHRFLQKPPWQIRKSFTFHPWHELWNWWEKFGNGWFFCYLVILRILGWGSKQTPHLIYSRKIHQSLTPNRSQNFTWAVFFLVVTALYTGGLPARKLTRGPFFVEGCLRALLREACFREMLSRTLLLFSTSWNENCHIFMDTFSPSWAHLPLHWHIVPFMGTSSPSWAHLPCKDTWRGGWRDMVCFRESFREAFAGIREGPKTKTLDKDPYNGL